ncbi:hypothetical protein ABVK25_004506 [Lepraria finkii]|uniref:Uncharacterized protein n=1 Tax=Lepraria finkii TaxID=1340010 RepID=A0ABR4BBE3_9LECA
MARFEPSHGSVCFTEPDRFLIPILFSGEVRGCGSEAYNESILEPEVINLGLEEREEQLKKANTINEVNAKPLHNYPEQISAESEEALQHKWVDGVSRFLLIIDERSGKHVGVHSFAKSQGLPEPTQFAFLRRST